MPAEDDNREVGSEVERAVMLVLLNGRMFSRTELTREVAGSRGRESEVEDAIENLYAAGMLHIIDGTFLFVSRAARCTDGLGL